MCEGDQSPNLHQNVFIMQTVIDVAPCGDADVTETQQFW